jgi:hypothetical protein
MADETELHPAVELLLARMESHPEEFATKEKVYATNSRLSKMISLYGDILNRASEKEVALLRAAMDKIQLDLLHNDLMDELLNGEDRRKAEEKAEHERNMLIQKASMQQYASNAQAVGLAPGQYGQANQSIYDVDLDRYRNEALRINSHGSVGIGSVTPYTQLGSGITGKSASMAVLDEMLDMTPTPSLLQRSKSFFRK